MGTIDHRLDELHPDSWFRQNLIELSGIFHSPVSNPRRGSQCLELHSLRCAEESLEGSHVSRLALLQGCEQTAAIVIGDNEPKVRLRLQLSHEQARGVVHGS